MHSYVLCAFFCCSNDRRMALIQMGSTEEATAALIVSETCHWSTHDSIPILCYGIVFVHVCLHLLAQSPSLYT